MSDLSVGDVLHSCGIRFKVIAVTDGDDRVAYVERRTDLILQPEQGRIGVAGWKSLRVDIPHGGGAATLKVWTGPYGWKSVWSIPRHMIQAVVSTLTDEPDRNITDMLLDAAIPVLK